MKTEIKRCGPRVDLDLKELDLVDVEGVRSQLVRGAAYLSATLLALYQGSGCSWNEGRPTGKGWLEEEDEKQVWRGAVGFTSGNEHRRSQLTGNRKERRNCGARHAV